MSNSALPRVVIIDEELPFPPNTGKRIRTYHLMSRLARRFQLVFLCHRNADPQEFAQAHAHFTDLGIECRIISRELPNQSVLSSGAKFYGSLALNLLSSRPYLVDKHDSRPLRAEIDALARGGQVDLWHCEWTPYAAPFLDSARGPWVVAAHNVESQIWERYLEHETNPLKRWYIRGQCRKFRKFEEQAFGRAGASIFVSDADAELATASLGATRGEVVENGVDLDYFAPGPSPRNPHELLFLGSLDWRPNLDAIRQLLDAIYPEVLAAVPTARLTIVGRKPPQWLRERIPRERSVELHSDVPDVRPFLHRCGMLVVPLRIGGGSRLKILEALACECPVISTTIGAEGLALRPGVDYIQTPHVDDFAAATVAAMHNHSQLLHTASAGRSVVQDHYGWDNLADKLAEIWQQQLSSGNAPQRQDGRRAAKISVLR